MHRNKKGFTLIELIVVISIVAILVGLAIGISKGYTKDAKKVEYKNNIKILEQASEQYYMKHGTWPKLTENHFTSEQLETYANRIWEITGEEVSLEPEGKYYEINYPEISKYTRFPKEKGNYILQNPVGKVYYLEDVTEQGKTNLSNYTEETGATEAPIQDTPVTPIIFSGLGHAAFDGDLETKHNVPGETTQYITWEGNLDGRKLSIKSNYSGEFGASHGSTTYTIYDVSGKVLEFNTVEGASLSSLVFPSGNPITKEIIVPHGASKISVRNNYYFGAYVYEISVGENPRIPQEVSNIKTESTDSSITLSWDQPETDYKGVVIYRDGVRVGYTENKTYTDKPLYSDTEHTYTIKVINIAGNGSKGTGYTSRTTLPDIIFSGLSPEAFDGDLETKYNVPGETTKYITWEGNLDGRKLSIKSAYRGDHGSTTYTIYDVNGKVMEFNTVGGESLSKLAFTGLTSKEIIVPHGASKIGVNNNYYYYADVYEITAGESQKIPQEVSNIKTESTDSSITLSWEQKEQNYKGVIIYRDGTRIGYTENKTYTDKPLYSDTEHTYTLKVINIDGNGSKGINYTSRTTRPEIAFRGLSPAVFDGDLATQYTVPGMTTQYITWEGNLEGRTLSIKSAYRGDHGSTTFRILDSTGKIMTFNTVGGTSMTGIAFTGLTTKEIIVPEGAVKISVNNNYYFSADVYELTVVGK